MERAERKERGGGGVEVTLSRGGSYGGIGSNLQVLKHGRRKEGMYAAHHNEK